MNGSSGLPHASPFACSFVPETPPLIPIRRISTLSQIYQALVDLDDLLIDGKPPLKRPSNAKKNEEPYDRTSYWAYAADTKDAFRKLYMFCFTLVKPPWVVPLPFLIIGAHRARSVHRQSRNIDMEVRLSDILPIMACRLDTYH